MNKKHMWFIGATLAILILTIVFAFILKGCGSSQPEDNIDNSSALQDDGNWTSIYEATPVD